MKSLTFALKYVVIVFALVSSVIVSQEIPVRSRGNVVSSPAISG
jgi:hypothetical protein